jgi:NAD(P)-dependent dehydrogenase (short-subunit alcohol dehydrogenase family)
MVSSGSSLSSRTALVTGGGRGIGQAIASRLSRDGARVVVAGRTETEIQAVANEIGGVALRVDLGDRADVERAIGVLSRDVGHIDILVNNAGIAVSAPYDKTTDAMWDQTFEINVHAAFALTRALVPPMIKSGFGRVINVASNAGRMGYAYTTAYCAAKHAMVGMTRALAAEIARSSVTVNAVCPGWTDTRMVDEATSRIAGKTGRSEEHARATLAAMSPQNRLMEATEVAHLVASLCAVEARGIHGQAIPIDGGQVMA